MSGILWTWGEFLPASGALRSLHAAGNDTINPATANNDESATGDSPCDVAVLTIRPTGTTTTVHNLTIHNTHNYHVLTTPTTTGPDRTTPPTPILVHNNGSCDPLTAGEARSFRSLDARKVRYDNLTPHHMPQNGLGFLSRGDGGALMLPHDEHIMTRTYGAKGRLTKAADAGKPFREVLETDIDDIKHLFGDKYDEGIEQLRDYYRKNYPKLYGED